VLGCEVFEAWDGVVEVLGRHGGEVVRMSEFWSNWLTIDFYLAVEKKGVGEGDVLVSEARQAREETGCRLICKRHRDTVICRGTWLQVQHTTLLQFTFLRRRLLSFTDD
jgi:hypothetical protein